MAAFKAAAAAVAERQAEAAMSTEDRIMKYLTRWCDAWRDDLERRSSEIKESGPGAEIPSVISMLVAESQLVGRAWQQAATE